MISYVTSAGMSAEFDGKTGVLIVCCATCPSRQRAGRSAGRISAFVEIGNFFAETQSTPAFGKYLPLGGAACPTQDTEFGAMGVI